MPKKSKYVTLRGKKYLPYYGKLDMSQLGITDINEIEEIENLNNYFLPLDELDLKMNMITEIKGLEKLTTLRGLYLSRNKITEIKGLNKLTNLETLSLDNNNISEIKGLKSLYNLQVLSISYNQIKELKELDYLTNLRNLHLNGNQINEIKGLENLTNLKAIYLNANPILDWEIDLGKKNAQELVSYCRKRKSDKKLQKINNKIKIANMITPFKSYNYETNNEPFVFASYAHSDKNVVYPIIKRLHENGIHIWYDEGIPLSAEWREKIAQALRNCSKFLVFLTKTSITRPNVIREINFALNRYDKSEITILPIHLEKLILSDELEFSLGSIQSLMRYSWDEESFYSKLLNLLVTGNK